MENTRVSRVEPLNHSIYTLYFVISMPDFQTFLCKAGGDRELRRAEGNMCSSAAADGDKNTYDDLGVDGVVFYASSQSGDI